MKYKYSIIFLLLLLPFAVVIGQDGMEGVELKNLEEVNGEYEDNFPIPYKDGFIYTKARVKAGIFKPKLYEGTKRYTDIMFAKKAEDGKYISGKLFGETLNKKWFDGAVAFNSDFTKIYYTQSAKKKNSQDSIVLRIVEADFDGTNWSNEKVLSFNDNNWNSAHPTLSADGNTLYFSSNKPGGQGGMDLYSATKNSEGVWSNVSNLGADVNTNMNELFPHIGPQGNLFYSSNYCGECPDGKDLDIYAAQQNDGEDWKKIGSLETPFNSGADDVNFVVNAEGNGGFLATAREGGKGFDDIYEWTYEPEIIEATIVIVDEDTGERLEEAKVQVTPTSFGNVLDQLYNEVGPLAIETFVTPKSGKVDYANVRPSSDYTIHVEKSEYFPKDVVTNTAELTEKDEYIIPIKREVIKSNLNINVVDASTNLPIPGATIKVENLTTGEIEEFTADGNGKFSMEIDCKHNFKITGSKKLYSDFTMELSDLVPQCREGDVEATLPLKPVMLVNVYFDFDKDGLRVEDIPELGKLLDLLAAYPNYTVELRGHTDSRGSKSYNKKLSEERAQAVLNWLVENGVDENRMVAVGLGELELVNDCADGVKCTELEHQLNRRTEFKVLNKKVEIQEIKSQGQPNPRVDPCKHCN